MDYTKLAEMLYPHTTKTIDDLLAIYPTRHLPKGAEVTRFAPSPTGYLHFGSFCGAMTDKMIAKSSGGIFYMRLEDTDGKRTIDDADKVALNVLKIYGIYPDEGYLLDGQIGAYGPYKQSERVEIYNTFAKRLVELGRAYPCFCSARESKAEILKDRKNQLENSNTIETIDPCRNLTLDEIEQHLKNGDSWALRFKSMGKQGETFTYTDVAKGERTMPKNTMDYVIVKSNGVPVYHLAHVADDTLMHTTTVIRGNEWLGTLPLHVEMFEALNLPKPKYLHTCLVMKKDETTGNTRKISKRYDKEADMRFYLNAGYPVEAVNRYVMNLINSGYESWALANPDAPLKDYHFDCNNLTTSDPMFDIAKLNDISKTVISKYTTDEVYNKAVEWAKEYNLEDYDKLTKNSDAFKTVLSIDRGGDRPRKDIVKFSDITSLYDYMLDLKFEENDARLDFIKNYPHKQNMVDFIIDYADSVTKTNSNSEWFDEIKQIALRNNFADNKDFKLAPEKYAGKVADAVQAIRIAFTGRTATPELYSIMNYFSLNDCRKRIKQILQFVK